MTNEVSLLINAGVAAFALEDGKIADIHYEPTEG